MRLANADVSAQDLAMAIADMLARKYLHLAHLRHDRRKATGRGGPIFDDVAKAADILVNIGLENELSAIAILSPPASTFLSPARVLRTPSVLTSKPQMLAMKTAHTLGIHFYECRQ